WIPAASTELIDARQHIPSGSEHDEERRQLKHKLWWVAKAKEMEKAAAIGNSRQLFRFIREMGIRNPTVSETISEKDGSTIHCQSRRLDRWAEHFREQFNWPLASTQLPTISKQSEWQIDIGPPSLSE
ncbi:hypothetical protein EWB00_007437, partial [Schistosoma japonicum]